MNRLALSILCIGAGLAAACGGTTAAPSLVPAIVCPVSQTVQSTDGKPISVAFAPTSITGTNPLTVLCAPAGGSAFPVGSTTVTCTVVDAGGRQASCSFGVTVSGVPRASATKFTAFGDSITAGVIATCTTASLMPLQLRSPAQQAEELRALFAGLDESVSYPTVLRAMLANRYSAQATSVINDGYPGECVVTRCTDQPDALTRLRNALDAERPDVLLLQEGVNDLNGLHSAGIPAIRDALQTMVQAARGRGVQVLVGTLLPQRAGACRGYAVPDVPPMNDAIRAMAAANGVTLVDVYQAFGGSADPYIGQDGLHPNSTGYQKMAETFFKSIESKFEVTSSAAPTPTSR